MNDSHHNSSLEGKSLMEFSPELDVFAKSRKKTPRRWILTHILAGKNKYFVLIVLVTTILGAILSSQLYVVVGLAIDDFEAGNQKSLLFWAILVLILGISAPIIRLGSFMLREVVAQKMERDTRKEFLTNLLGKSQSFHEQQKAGEIMARSTEDVRMLNFLMSPAISLIFESFTSLFVPIIFIALFFPLELAIWPLIFTVLFLIALKRYNRKLGPVTMDLRTTFGQMDDELNEKLSGIELVKSTAQESKEFEKYTGFAKKYKAASVQEGRIQAKYTPLLFIAVTITAGLAHAIYLYYQNRISIGAIIAYIGLLSLLRFPTNISIFVFAIVKLASASAERLLSVMNKETEIDENATGVEQAIKGKVKFENISFKYPDDKNYVLKHISFEVKPGQTVAIVGTTGSGKTTLTKLISRLYDVNEGKITIDDIDVKDFSLNSLRSQISYIEQDVFLFSTSIYENISFGRTSSMDEVVKVAKLAQAHDFITGFLKGYESEVGERGVQLSGGERQRVAIARAFLTDPRILILDDSTSAIDSETEDKIQQAINNALKGRTTFLITHRLSQIRWADLILVLKNGQIDAMGTHEGLLKTSEEYRKIFVKKFDVEVEQLLKEVS